jgi:hypothetical protein
MGLATDRHARANRADLAQAAWLHTRDIELVEEAELMMQPAPARPIAKAAPKPAAKPVQAKAPAARPMPARPIAAKTPARPVAPKPIAAKPAMMPKPVAAKAPAKAPPARIPVAAKAPVPKAPVAKAPVTKSAQQGPTARGTLIVKAPSRPRDEPLALNTGDIELLDPVEVAPQITIAPQITESQWFQDDSLGRISPPTEIVDVLGDEPVRLKTGLLERMPVLLGLVFGAFVLGAIVVFFFVHTMVPAQTMAAAIPTPATTTVTTPPPAPAPEPVVEKIVAPAPTVTALPVAAPEPAPVAELPRPIVRHAAVKHHHHAVAHVAKKATPRVVASARKPRSSGKAAGGEWYDPFGQ